MRKLRKFIAFMTIAVASLSMSACLLDYEEGDGADVSAYDMVGVWRKNFSQEYWRYRYNGTGVTWDESDGISENTSNLTYDWELDGSVITHIFTGAQGNQMVPKSYTITSISSSSMTWRDNYGISYSFTKVD